MARAIGIDLGMTNSAIAVMGAIDEIQSAIKRYEDAHARYDGLMPIAHTKIPGVKIEPEPDDAALRAQQREAKTARDEAWGDLTELVQMQHPPRE